MTRTLFILYVVDYYASIVNWFLLACYLTSWRKAFDMQIPAKITFHNLDPSAALETRIKEKISKLDRRFTGLIGLHVIVEASHRHQQRGILYTVRIDVTLPGGEVVVSHHPGKNPLKHDKVFAAMNSAFAAIEKQLDRFKELIRYEVKSHIPHWREGVVSNLFPDEGFGFIASFGGDEVYFHKNAVQNDNFSELDIGSKVKFVLAEGEGDKGPQASAVRLSGRRKKAKA